MEESIDIHCCCVQFFRRLSLIGRLHVSDRLEPRLESDVIAVDGGFVQTIWLISKTKTNWIITQANNTSKDYSIDQQTPRRYISVHYWDPSKSVRPTLLSWLMCRSEYSLVVLLLLSSITREPQSCNTSCTNRMEHLHLWSVETPLFAATTPVSFCFRVFTLCQLT
jgi:hypothetical protein